MPCGDRLLPKLSGKSISHSALTTAGHHMGLQTRGCKYSLELLMMSGVPLGIYWAFNKLWNNKFYYKAASCWYFYWENLKWYIVDVRWTDMQYLKSQGAKTLCLLLTFSHYQTSAIPWQDIFKLLKDLQPCCKEQSIAHSNKICCMKTAQLHAKHDFDTDVTKVLKILKNLAKL
jgi:hypothetical protein